MKFHPGQRVIVHLTDTDVKAIVVAYHGFTEEFPGVPMWALSNIRSYGTMIMGESCIEASDWTFPWEDEEGGSYEQQRQQRIRTLEELRLYDQAILGALQGWRLGLSGIENGTTHALDEILAAKPSEERLAEFRKEHGIVTTDAF